MKARNLDFQFNTIYERYFFWLSVALVCQVVEKVGAVTMGEKFVISSCLTSRQHHMLFETP